MTSPNIKRIRNHSNNNSSIVGTPQQRIFVVIGCCLLLMILKGSRNFLFSSYPTQKQLLFQKKLDSSIPGSSSSSSSSVPSELRILYIVTTLAEYDTGQRATKKGWDRLQGVLIPVISEGIRSMVTYGYSVDVVLICHFTMLPERYQLVREGLPDGVGLQVWDDASPLGYKLEDKKANHTQHITRALARQHRYVIKDKLEHYDVFLNFEDDMLIKGDAVQNYVEMTQELYKLRETAPDTLPESQLNDKAYYGVMTKAMLRRTLPGFIRVEVLLDEAHFGTQDVLDPVPVSNRPQIDPQPCCHVSDLATSETRPSSPKSDDMFLWETNIIALGVRKMPLQSQLFKKLNDGWVTLLRGPLVKERNLTIPDYWSGKDGYFGDGNPRPHPKSFPHINNQGGWMATREQIWEWHTQVCAGSFLPPYEAPNFNFDGLDTRNVEYWSGGLHMFTREHGCMLQRIVSLDPNRLSRQLLYHTANNKQRQLKSRNHMFVKINDLLGQLNTVRTNAEAEMKRRVAKLASGLKQ